jgi:pyrimidine-nucleoside phosphorylase
MNALDIIAKKRDGLALTKDEIHWFITEYSANRLPDYQAAAWLMAVYLKGMTREEVVNLTLAMAHSGEVLDLRDVVGGFVIDKHSSGGVGDKTSLVVIPLVAACGVPVAKMSGRGLGHTGGTLDKLESIEGFKIELDQSEFRRIAKTHKVVLAGQSANLAPADKLLYALRDVTATVASMPLIASSIMSKKLAAGADGIVLDVKVGRGAFMSTVEEARELAQMMVNIGTDAGKRMVALLSDMDQPLGKAAGLALEVKEAIEVLHNGGPADFREHCLVAAAHMLRLAGKGNMKETRALAELALIDRSAFAKFREMVGAQGGNVKQVDEINLLPTAQMVDEIAAPKRGFVAQVDALAVGQAVLELGGGRLTKTDPVDHAVGVLTHVKVGDAVTEGQPIFTIHSNNMAKMEAARQRLLTGLSISEEPVARLPLFYDVIEG